MGVHKEISLSLPNSVNEYVIHISYRNPSIGSLTEIPSVDVPMFRVNYINKNTKSLVH